ncbi:chloramphenicol phosphotransferase CPT family protein [Devosia sp.]|uniref:chloramphenicol phosphotransferase CPT family protein n=1 Tax=Devosia sp. TaxID=1871048 RepID=UPI003A8F71BE
MSGKAGEAGQRAQIVLLNGVGSAGKSSIARALQDAVATPLLHVQMDSFLEMLPARFANHPETFSFTPVATDGPPEVAISGGTLGTQLMRGMRAAVQALASEGLNLIVDDVLMGSADPGMAEYRRLLAGFDLHTVGVFAHLETLEQREKARGDRMIGLARWQYDRVHAGMDYDLVVHSDSRTPAEIAGEIITNFGL